MASVKIPEQKVILCGEFGVGKSSLFRRYMSDSFTTATDRFERKFLFIIHSSAPYYDGMMNTL